VISGFYHAVDENWTLLSYYAVTSGESVRNYHYSLHNNPEGHSSQLLSSTPITKATTFDTLQNKITIFSSTDKHFKSGSPVAQWVRISNAKSTVERKFGDKNGKL
jgi:hypothetical protein